MTQHRCKVLFLFLIFFFSAGQASALSPSAVISPDDQFTYVIECSNFHLTKSAEIVVDYPSSLGQPQVIPGGMAGDSVMTLSLMPSMIRIELKATEDILPSGGILVSIWFPQASQDNPIPVGVSGTVVGSDGKKTSLRTWYQGRNDDPKAPDPDKDDEQQTSGGVNDGVPTGPATQGNPGAPGIGSGTGGGVGQTKSLPDPARGAQATEPTAKLIRPVVSEVRDSHLGGAPPVGLVGQSALSVLDRFRLFQGETTETALRRLFDADPGSSFHQTPAVVLTDGRSPVKVVFDLALPGQQVNYLILKNMRMISFKYLDDGAKAEIKALPEPGGYQASLLVKTEDRTRYFPLTVAPPLPPALSAAGVRDGKIVRLDYNGDSRVDYLDDYLLMANRMVLFP